MVLICAKKRMQLVFIRFIIKNLSQLLSLKEKNGFKANEGFVNIAE